MRDRSVLEGDEPGNSFGARLRRYREAAGLSQEQLAERAGLSAHAIGAIERGNRRQPYVHTIELLATALDLRSSERAELLAAVPRVRLSVLPRRLAVANPTRPPLLRPTTALLGREREEAAVGALLRQPQLHLLTLVGPGGVGKTRLALQVAANLAGEFADGVAFVALGTLTSVDSVPAAIARSLGLPPDGGGEPAHPVADFLRARRILLVLDNCEHLPFLATLVADLLRAAPGLTVLATSRELLRVSAEREFPVSGLSVPEAADHLTTADLAGYAAVRLFVERAQLAMPTFTLTASNAPTIATIGARLDGLPLAIELAAARIKFLTPAALLRRLDRRLSVLTGGARDAPARQQTLRDAIQWSYDLLSPPEQALFRRLAVFADGWSLELAEGAGIGDHVPILDLLQSLVDKSLVRLVGGEAEPRFRMLETIREFASEKLDARGEAALARDRHLASCLALVEDVAAEIWRPSADEPPRVERLDDEHENILAALNWAAARPNPLQALRRGAALGWFWWHRAFAFVAAPETTAPPPEPRELRAARSAAWFGAAYVAWHRGDYAEASARFEASRKTWPDVGIGAAAEVARSTRGLAFLTRWERLDLAAQLAFEHALTRTRAANDHPGVAAALAQLGWLAFFREDNCAALRYFAEADTYFATLHLNAGRAAASFGQGWVAHDGGDVASARQHYLASLGLLPSTGDDPLAPYVIENLGMLAAADGDLKLATVLAGAAAAVRASSTVALPIAFVALRDRWVSRARQELGDAAFAASWSRGAHLSLDQVIKLRDEG